MKREKRNTEKRNNVARKLRKMRALVRKWKAGALRPKDAQKALNAYNALHARARCLVQCAGGNVWRQAKRASALLAKAQGRVCVERELALRALSHAIAWLAFYRATRAFYTRREAWARAYEARIPFPCDVARKMQVLERAHASALALEYIERGFR